MMDINELYKKLEENNVPKDCYNLTGTGLKDQKMCLINKGEIWQVYYSERGQKFDYKEFITEKEACEEIYKRLI